MNIITHRADGYNLVQELQEIKKRLESDDNNNNNNKKLLLFNQLCEFEFGRWLLVNRGLNSYWSYYLVYCNEINTKQLHPLESIMLEKSPGVLAARERAALNHNIMQKMIHNGMKLASIPCGYMNDLLRLDLKDRINVRLVGIDLDPHAIEQSKINSKKFNKETICSFFMRDAWELEFENEFDLINSGGLNMYVKNEADLVSLYANFYKALRPGGCLIVSSNTPPVGDNGQQVWNVTQTELDYVYLQALIYNEVIGVRQGVYCTENQIVNQLKSVGFGDICVDYDSRKMFLGFIAIKMK
jgi:SAM-dependent methyltransferase